MFPTHFFLKHPRIWYWEELDPRPFVFLSRVQLRSFLGASLGLFRGVRWAAPVWYTWKNQWIYQHGTEMDFSLPTYLWTIHSYFFSNYKVSLDQLYVYIYMYTYIHIHLCVYIYMPHIWIHRHSVDSPHFGSTLPKPCTSHPALPCAVLAVPPPWRSRRWRWRWRGRWKNRSWRRTKWRCPGIIVG